MKDQIRRELIVRRKKLSEKEVFDKSFEIKNRLFDSDIFRNAISILFYVSYGGEVFTHDMIKECLILKKNVIVPKSNIENRTLILSKLVGWDDLEVGSYNILEPKSDKIIEFPIEDIDLIIVPGVGFDLTGRRIGHGKGYYDNLLKKSKAVHIGLAFEFQIVDEIPTENHDIPVDIIITEGRIINCRN
jgi:5-formyltetrahydrofolate cyclo-ligase